MREISADWKSANVKGSESNKNSYRPVSLTSIVDKLDENKLIYSGQHGFTKGKLYLTNLIEFFHRIFEWCDKGDSLGIVYLDFSKAFHKVTHERLTKKIGGLWDSGECLKMDSRVAGG